MRVRVEGLRPECTRRGRSVRRRLCSRRDLRVGSFEYVMMPFVLAAVGILQAGSSQVEGWRVVPVFDERDLSVLVRVKERANASDEGWLVLEFVNGGKEP